MASRQVAYLEMSRHPHRSENPALVTRGGLSGVHVWFQNFEIRIPRDVILRLVAEEYRSEMISKYEQASEQDLIAEMMRNQ